MRDFVRPTGVWQPSAVPTAADIGQLDLTASQLVNGDAGGTYAPASPIVFGGAPNGIGGGAYYGTYTGLSGSLVTKNGGRIYLPPTTWPGLARTLYRNVYVDLFRCAGNFGSNTNGLQVSTAPMGVFPSVPYGPGFTFAIPKRFLHQGASLSSLVLNMQVANNGQGIPTICPSLVLTVVDVWGSVLARSFTMQPVWKPTHTYTAGMFVIPPTTLADGFTYECTTGGVSGSTPVAWPGVLGGVVVDGTVSWTCVDQSGQMSVLAATNAYGGHGVSNASVTMTLGAEGATWASSSGALVVDSSQYEYVVTVAQDNIPVPGVTFTSLQLGYTNITTLQTE